MKIIQLIKRIYQNIVNYFRYRKMTKTLIKGAKAKNNDRLKLDFLMAKERKKFLKNSKSNTSDFIPLDFSTRQKLKFHLETEFGEQMAQLNLKLNDDFQLV